MTMKRTEYSIQHCTSGGDWVDEGVYFDTYEEAREEIKLYPGQPKEKYRIEKRELTVMWTSIK